MPLKALRLKPQVPYQFLGPVSPSPGSLRMMMEGLAFLSSSSPSPSRPSTWGRKFTSTALDLAASSLMMRFPASCLTLTVMDRMARLHSIKRGAALTSLSWP